MNDPAAYDPYLGVSPHDNTHTNFAYHNQYNGQDDARQYGSRNEKHNGQYSEVQLPGPDSGDADLRRGLYNRPPQTMGTGAAGSKVINWPDGPGVVKQSLMGNLLTFALDATLVLAALLFLALAILALRFADEPADSRLAVALEAAMKLSPTIYPILFAALLGRTLRSIGRWRVERGTRVIVSIIDS
jgi:hypothetical protein